MPERQDFLARAKGNLEITRLQHLKLTKLTGTPPPGLVGRAGIPLWTQQPLLPTQSPPRLISVASRVWEDRGSQEARSPGGLEQKNGSHYNQTPAHPGGPQPPRKGRPASSWAQLSCEFPLDQWLRAPTRIHPPPSGSCD